MCPFLKKKNYFCQKFFSRSLVAAISDRTTEQKKNLRDAAVLFEIKYLLIRFVCAFSLFVCVFFYWSAPGDLSKDDYHKNKHTLPSPTLLCFLPQNSPKQNKYENINPIAPSDPNRIFEGTCTGFGAYFSFLHRLVWCEFAVCCLTFIFITFLVSSA